MLTKEGCISYLLKNDHLWDIETKHEATYLCKTIFEKWPDVRETLEKVILQGPPRFPEESEEDFKERSDYEIFSILDYLEKERLPLLEKAKKHLKEIKLRYPELDKVSPIKKRPDKTFTADDLVKVSPPKVIELLKEYQEPRFPWSRQREISEATGLACIRNPGWCLQLFAELRGNINELSEDMINPIFWGMESQEAKETWKTDHIKKLFSVLELLVEVRAEGGFWSSLPRLFRKWAKSLDLRPDDWGNLAKRLWTLFATFDYERKEESTCIDWIQRAINHPFGILAELYLETAYKMVSDQAKLGKKYEIDPEIINFFKFVIDNYDAHGARYGSCILAKSLSWIEAVLPDWTKENLIPLFYLANANKEATLVVWSGYLWSRTLSRSLAHNFKNSYLSVAKFYNDFSEQDRKSFVVHIAGHSWFLWIDLGSLKEFIKIIDREGRRELLHSFVSHFERAEENVVESFWQTTLLPYWDWCGQQGFLELPDGDKERFDFWRLLPYTYAIFPKAKKRAIRWAPNKIEQVALFPEKIAECDLGNRFPDDFIDFLIAFIKADQNPHWHDDQWQKIWEKVKDKGGKNLEDLRNELARKDVI